MELYVDSADFSEIRKAVDLGFLEGITTTPTIMHKNGIKDVNSAIVELSGLANQYHIEALGETSDQILQEADRLLNLPGLVKPPVFKIPITNEGLKAGYKLHKQGFKTNIHLIYTLNQAYMAAESGATYICPLVGRLHDQGHDSFALVQQIVQMTKDYGYDSKVMVSSVRHPEHVRLAILNKAHAVTVPWKVMKILVENSLTGLGIEDFAINTKLNTFTVKQFISERNPVIGEDATVGEAVVQMTQSKLGVVSIVNDTSQLIGVFTDGDLRRSIDHKNIVNLPVKEFMTPNPKCVTCDIPIQDAIDLLQQHHLDNLIIVDSRKQPIGILDIQDLLNDGLL
jgi:TalC/MipB family fructose-6-phosphate aldolase